MPPSRQGSTQHAQRAHNNTSAHNYMLASYVFSVRHGGLCVAPPAGMSSKFLNDVVSGRLVASLCEYGFWV